MLKQREKLSGESCEALLAPAGCKPCGAQPKFEAYMMTGDLMLNLTRVAHKQHNYRANYHRHVFITWNLSRNEISSSFFFVFSSSSSSLLLLLLFVLEFFFLTLCPSYSDVDIICCEVLKICLVITAKV